MKGTNGVLVIDDAEFDAAFAAAKRTLERTYTTSTVMHFALGPINALAFEKDSMSEVHTSNQWQTVALPWLAKALKFTTGVKSAFNAGLLKNAITGNA